MSEYIRREDAVGVIEKEMKNYISDIWYKSAIHSALNDVNENIKSLEPADVVPMVHAYWIPQKENHEFKEVWMKCSACGYPVSRWTGNTNFCPNCGAKMDGEE